MLEHLDRFLDGVQVEAGAPLDDRQAVVRDVFQVVEDQHAQHVAVRRLRRQLQQQALLEVAGADAGRVELLDDAQRLLDLGRRDAVVVAAASSSIVGSRRRCSASVSSGTVRKPLSSMWAMT